MKKTLFYSWFGIVCLVLFCTACTENKPAELRVMSFNTWHGGGKSVSATADVIVKCGADIVGIQEATRNGNNTAVAIADSLGWYSYAIGGSCAIISKYPIADTSASGKGVKIQIDAKRFVWMFNVHLMHCPYGPYQLNGIEYCGAPLLSTAEEAIEAGWEVRKQEVQSVIADIKEVQNSGMPVFLTGDFNEPSYADWTARAVEAGLCKMVVEWPAVKAFCEQAGMADSYRKLFPDEVENPGRTWTPLPEAENYTEVPDRIDFILYRGVQVSPIKVLIAGEESPLSNIKFANYPSDHRAVISTFSILW